MSTTKIILARGIQANIGAGRLGVLGFHAPEGRHPTVRLGIRTDDERVHELRLGDTFPVRDPTWKPTGIGNPYSRRWTITICRVAGGEER